MWLFFLCLGYTRYFKITHCYFKSQLASNSWQSFWAQSRSLERRFSWSLHVLPRLPVPVRLSTVNHPIQGGKYHPQKTEIQVFPSLKLSGFHRALSSTQSNTSGMNRIAAGEPDPIARRRRRTPLVSLSWLNGKANPCSRGSNIWWGKNNRWKQ